MGTLYVGKLLGISRDRVSALCRKGAFPHASQDSQGHPWHIPESDVDEYKKKRKTIQ